MRMSALVSVVSVLTPLTFGAVGAYAASDLLKPVGDQTTEKANPAKTAKTKSSEVKIAAADTPAKPAEVAAEPADAATPAKPANPEVVFGGDSQESMVVTARRRRELLKDIPGATTVISGEETEKLGINDTRALVEQIPGTQVAASGASYNDDIEMRGQGAGRNSIPIGSVSESSTGIYQNGVYVAGGNINGRQLNEMNFFDVSRFEVLSGPQGALYGRNAVGGAINVVTNMPQSGLSARETVAMGNNDTYIGSFVANLPLDDANGIAARLGGFINDQNSGYVTNLQTGNSVDWLRTRGGRIGLQVKPNDDFRAYGAFEYYTANTPSYSSYTYTPTQDNYTTGGRDPYVRDNLNSEGRTISTMRTGYLAIDKTTDIGDASVKLYRRSSSGGQRENDFDHFATVNTLLVGQPNLRNPFGNPSPILPIATPVSPVLNGTQLDLRQNVEETFDMSNIEATLASNTNGRLKWLAGLEGLKSSDELHTYFEGCQPAGTFNVANKFTQAAMEPGCAPGYFGALPAYAGAGAGLAYNQTYYKITPGSAAIVDQTNTEYLSSWAVYGTVSYDLTDKVTLGAEYRFQKDMKSIDFQYFNADPQIYYGPATNSILGCPVGGCTPAQLRTNTGLNYVPYGSTYFCPPSAGPTCGYAGGNFSGALAWGTLLPTLTAHKDAAWHVGLPSVNINYKLNAKNSIYARWATGYRPGGFNNPAFSATFGSTAPTVYNPERSASTELGWNGNIFGGYEVSADIFYQKTYDIQVIELTTQVPYFYLQNAGNGYTYGAEAQIRKRYKMGPGLLVNSLSLSTNYGRYSDTTPVTTLVPGTTIDINGNRIPRTRNIQGAVNSDYLMRVGGGYTVDTGFSWQFASGGNEDAANTKRNNGYGTLNLRAMLLSKDFFLTAYAKNVLDRRYELLSIGSNNDGYQQYWSQPRSFGLTLTLMQ